MLAPYRDLLAIPGAWKFMLAAWVGRLSLTMIGLSIVLLVSAISGSYGKAGAVTATFSIMLAVAAPQLGRLVDRLGQSKVLPPLIAVHTCGLLALIACAELGTPDWTLFVTAGLAGIAMPMTGSMARARWANLLRGTPRLDTAFSLESVLSEMGFMLGPLLATLLATHLHRSAGLVVALICTVCGASALATLRSTQPPASRGRGTEGASAIRVPGLMILVGAFLATGTLAGSMELVIVAFAEEEGARTAAGFVLGTHAFGSLLAGLAYGAWTWRSPPHRRLLLALVGITLGIVPFLLATGIPLLIVGAFLGGLTFSPTLIPAFALVERLVPVPALTEGFTWVTTAVSVGIALGTSLAGQAVDSFSARPAFLVSLGAGLAALAIAGSGRRWLRTEPRPGETAGDTP